MKGPGSTLEGGEGEQCTPHLTHSDTPQETLKRKRHVKGKKKKKKKKMLEFTDGPCEPFIAPCAVSRGPVRISTAAHFLTGQARGRVESFHKVTR